MSVADNEMILAKAIASFNSPTGKEGYFDLYDENLLLRGLPAAFPKTMAGMRSFYRGLWSAFPDIQLKVEDLISVGDTMGLRFSALGTHTNSFFGKPPSGQTVSFRIIMMLRFSDGKVVERWSLLDME